MISAWGERMLSFHKPNENLMKKYLTYLGWAWWWIAIGTGITLNKLENFIRHVWYGDIWHSSDMFGHMEHDNRSNVAPTELHKMSEHVNFSYNHSSTNDSANLCIPKRQAIACQHTVKLLLVLNDAHNPINNPTVQIADLREQNTLLLENSTTDRCAISHHDGYICSYHNDTPF